MTQSTFIRSRLAPLALVISMALAFVGCDSTGPSTSGNGEVPSTSGSGEVQVGFSTASSASTQLTSARAEADSDSLVLSGSNGTLEIHDLRLIVDKVKLEQDTEGTGEDSTEIEIEREVEVERPSFLDLPLQSSEVLPVAAGDVPEGTYNEFEFEVDDLDDDERGARELLSDIRSEEGFPNWPEDASMVVVGTFTPSDGAPTPFTTYFEAEIEVERTLSPPLEVTSDGLSRELVVRIDPARWFKRENGTVEALSQFDHEETGTVREFESEFEDGVAEIEYDD